MPNRLTLKIAKRVRKSAPANTVAAPLVAEQIPPTAAAFGAPILRAPECAGPRSRNQSDATAIGSAAGKNRQRIRYDRNLLCLFGFACPANKLVAHLLVRRAGDGEHQPGNAALTLDPTACLLDRVTNRAGRFVKPNTERVSGRGSPTAQHAFF